MIFVVLLCRALKSKNYIIRFIGFLCGFGSNFVVGLAGPKLYDLFFCAYPKLEDERTETGYILENFNKGIEIPNEFQLIDKQIINGQNKINCKGYTF